ncbi:DUF4465 domain-containing protein [Flavobacterium branchiarum]|uniref:DUF4465 domain-containing protein n=1 Tax=Flavobacterium branchiarum TaxID=1114870 RepID=A0ABV5FRL0_9FLAO|nr:DUF4465 domain-containing protein [Flavobacterium branchiarum]MDN3673310.1 DUF4465 domain-containing protein [Flavobacterium branchiarum]
MKKVFYFLTVGLLLGLSSCSNEDDQLVNGSSNATVNSANSTKRIVADPAIGTTTTLNLTSALLANGISTTGGKYWENTYVSNTKLDVDIFTFSHTAVSSGYNYWDGFIVSNVNDITNYGSGEGSGGSNGWVPNQWGTMAGSGFGTSTTTTAGSPGTPGDPYIVAYWSSYQDPKNPAGTTFNESSFSNWVKIGDSGLYDVKGLKINMHPWPYYGCLYGDGFAQPFNQGDRFELLIYGVNQNGIISAPIVHSLADYTGSSLVMPTGWKNVDTSNLQNLGKVKYLIFQMYSSDSHPIYGMNTAAYFCLDKLSVKRAN